MTIDLAGFTRVVVGGQEIYLCTACGNRRMKKKQIPYHRILVSHQKNSKFHVEAVIALPETGGIIEHNQTPSPEIVDNSNPIEGGGDAEMSDRIENIDRVEHNFSIGNEAHAQLLQDALGRIAGMTREDVFNQPDNQNQGAGEETVGCDWMTWLFEQMDTEAAFDGDGPESDDVEPNETNDPKTANTADGNQWFPFKNKMIRLVLKSLCQLSLPAWSTIRRAQERIRSYLDINLQFSTSVWGTPCVSMGVRSIIQKVS
ncbi:hypothetical protein PGTUg99_007170 [Puccinia graminis f. sp. tritici]|uniref:Uncharacterized protein n=1 Tax=Puccinia graminis f. sp. tritici TaxID=56615 RepID=A0A5B0MF16_PUCGR|nr:hypothetical protein PGTUg99_007170 [Puccinia graminis f. sp. tritici]